MDKVVLLDEQLMEKSAVNQEGQKAAAVIGNDKIEDEIMFDNPRIQSTLKLLEQF